MLYTPHDKLRKKQRWYGNDTALNIVDRAESPKM
jgi:hypothetical protein